MAQVKFVNRVKYNNVFHAAHTPFYVKDSDVDAMVAAGAIVLAAPAKTKEPTIVDGMTVLELKAFASSENIPLGEAERKADIKAVILAALEAKEEADVLTDDELINNEL